MSYIQLYLLVGFQVWLIVRFIIEAQCARKYTCELVRVVFKQCKISKVCLDVFLCYIQLHVLFGFQVKK